MKTLAVPLVFLLVCYCLPLREAFAAPQPMQRQHIAAIAASAEGFSYRWGGSRWLVGASDPGQCSANPGGTGCPDCVHKGAWGADCSGLLNVAWQLPGPLPTELGQHPYSSWHFATQNEQWSTIAAADALQGDAFAYSKAGKGHVFVVDALDDWGFAMAWECKGCAQGCTHNLRDVPAAYVAIRRNDLLPDVDGPCPAAGVAQRCLDTAELVTCASGSVVAVSSCSWVGKACVAEGAKEARCGW